MPMVLDRYDHRQAHSVHLFGTTPPGTSDHAPVGGWYTQTVSNPPRLLHWQMQSSGWAPRNTAPVEEIDQRPGWIARVLDANQRGNAAYLPPGQWKVTGPEGEDPGLRANGAGVRLVGIPSMTTLVGALAASDQRIEGPLTDTAISLNGAPWVALHGITFDGGVDHPGAIGWVIATKGRKMTSLVELRACQSVALSACTFTRCRGMAPGPDVQDLVERWNQGTLFALDCDELSIRDCRITWPAWIEGLVAINCGRVTITRLTAVADPSQISPKAGLSTPIHAFGPRSGAISIGDCTLVGHLGSAMNLGGRGPIEVTECRIAGSRQSGKNYGGGIDCGSELASLGWDSPPPIAKVTLTRNTIEDVTGPAIGIGGGSPEAQLVAPKVEVSGDLTIAGSATVSSLVPGQSVRVAGGLDDGRLLMIRSVDLVNHRVAWSGDRTDTPIIPKLIATGLRGTVLAERVLVAENTISRAETGIDVRAVHHLAILRNSLADIVATNGPGMQGVAISLIGAQDGIVDGNRVQASTPAGQAANGVFSWDCSQLTIDGNDLTGAAIGWVHRSGPTEEDSTLEFARNRLALNARAAIRLEASHRFAVPTLTGNSRQGRPLTSRDVDHVPRSHE